MEIENCKARIKSIYEKWKNLGPSMDDDTYAEIYEGEVRDLIIAYCESKNYEVEGYPFQKRILGETDENYDEDYFCYERDLKYLDVLATTNDDVLELMYFYICTFWEDQESSKQEYLDYLKGCVKNNVYDIDF